MKPLSLFPGRFAAVQKHVAGLQVFLHPWISEDRQEDIASQIGLLRSTVLESYPKFVFGPLYALEDGLTVIITSAVHPIPLVVELTGDRPAPSEYFGKWPAEVDEETRAGPCGGKNVSGG